MSSSKRNQRGVTVVELVLGTAVLGVVVAGAVLIFGRTGANEQADMAVKDAQRIHQAATTWQEDNREASGCPTVSQLQLEGQLDRDTRADDPWGQRFRILCSDGEIAVQSAGRDGQAGTGDDVRVPRSRG